MNSVKCLKQLTEALQSYYRYHLVKEISAVCSVKKVVFGGRDMKPGVIHTLTARKWLMMNREVFGKKYDL